ncbi:MAG: hypothetical protein OFPII_43580 [Osedax symbiont Rs1]|nr:MAG: hypothetical protein OFPII_43580 [Osedax symbiont Rs1]
MSINLSKVQADLCASKQLIHFNSAGSSLMPRQVLDCQVQYLSLEAKLGGYEAAAEKATEINAIYASVAKLINCDTSEVALVENATIGWMSAFYSIDFQAGDKILTAECEYVSNYLAYLKLRQEKGVIVAVIPSTSSGEVCISALEQLIDDRVKLISITHIPTNGGLVNPIEKIGKIAKQHDILYLVDACQAAGQLPIDVEEIQCDFLSATGRKYLRGPRGSGFLYVRKSVQPKVTPPVIDVRSATWTTVDDYQFSGDATKFENWENNYSALLGMGCAIDYALDIGLENIAAANHILAADLRAKLTLLPRVTVWDIGSEKCAIVSFSVSGIQSREIDQRLQHFNINVSHSTPASTLIDASRRKLPDVVRASVHYFNSIEQNDAFIKALTEIITS